MKRNQRVVARERGGEEDNVQAIAQGPAKKKWSKHDMIPYRPITEPLSEGLRAWFEGEHLALVGSAGTGKTLLAMYCAAHSLTAGDGIQQIVIIRSAVQAREIGHLPGTIEEKQAAYEEPYEASLGKLFNRVKTYEDMKAAGKVQFRLSSFLRGLTFDNSIIVMDEIQNMRFEEINTVVTRLGENSRLIMIGDTKQIDLTRRDDISGLEAACVIAKDVGGFTTVNFTRHDVVRSAFVKSWIGAVEDYEAGKRGNLRAA